MKKITWGRKKLFLREVYKFLKDEFGVIKLVTTTFVKELSQSSNLLPLLLWGNYRSHQTYYHYFCEGKNALQISVELWFHHQMWWRSLQSDDYFLSITLKWWAKLWSLRGDYGAITGWLRVITVDSDHHLFHYLPLLGRWWFWVMINKVMITSTVKKLKSNWAYECIILRKKNVMVITSWWQ